MRVQLRVLIVDDSEADAKLLLRELQRGGFEPAFERVDTYEAMKTALAKRTWDIIVADYAMPVFNGLEALGLMKGMGLDLPFFLVSGQISEDMAVAAMKAGAHDYVIKGNLARLIPAVERELREAAMRRERRDADEALRKAHAELRDAHAELEIRVQERTAELEIANIELHSEIEERKRIEEEKGVLFEQLRNANERLAITSLRAQQQATEASRQAAQLRALLESMAEGVTVLDWEGKVLLMNQAAREITGLSGDPDWENDRRMPSHIGFLHPDGTPIAARDWIARRVLNGERVVGQELNIVRPGGAQREVVISGSALQDDQGRTLMAILVYRDVTELRQLERAKQDYLSLISHDLRNPLAIIQGNAQVLQFALAKLSSDSRAHKAAEYIVTSAKRMNAMIKDLVDTARLESGQMELKKEPVYIDVLLSELVERNAHAGDWQRVKVEFSGDTSPVEADPLHLERILVNLITNALKFSPPESEVVVKAEIRNHEVAVSISDHGLGILPADLPRIFDRYFRARSGKKAAGLGLGLYITKMLVEAHNGRIRAESEPGKGSTFHVTLPIAESQPSLRSSH